MITRAFFICVFLFSLQVAAKSSGSLFLVGRVFPQVTVSVVSEGGNGASEGQSGYRISTNMPVGTYKVFVGDFKNQTHLKKKKAFRQLVVEAN